MRNMIKRLRAENGSVMMESIIVYLTTMMLLFFVLAIFSVLYQRWNIQTIANESVARMAQTYRFDQADESSGYLTEDQVTAVGPYRYFRSSRMEAEIKERITNYASWRMLRTTFAKSVEEPVIEVEVIGDAMGRRHLEMTITGSYTVPLGEILSYFGLESEVTYEVTANADCVDLVDYVNFVDFVKEQTTLGGLDSKVLDAISDFIGLISNILD